MVSVLANKGMEGLHHLCRDAGIHRHHLRSALGLRPQGIYSSKRTEIFPHQIIPRYEYSARFSRAPVGYSEGTIIFTEVEEYIPGRVRVDTAANRRFCAC